MKFTIQHVAPVVLAATALALYLVPITDQDVPDTSRSQAAPSAPASLPVIPARPSGGRTQHPATTPRIETPMFIAAGAGDEKVRYPVRVRVVNATSGQPLPFVKVEARSSAHVAAKGKVDRTGSGELSVPSGTYTLRMDPETLPAGLTTPPRQDEVYTGAPWPNTYGPSVEVDDAPFPDVVTLRAIPSAHLYGALTGPDLEPLAAVRVHCESIRNDRPIHTYVAITDEQGHYELDVVPGAYRIQIATDVTHLSPTRPVARSIRLAAAETMDVSYRIAPGSGSITGMVLDPALMPGEEEIRWEDLRVILTPWMDTGMFGAPVRGYRLNHLVAEVRTDAEGRYTLEGLMDGEYKVHFAPYEFSLTGEPGRLGDWIPSERVTVSGGSAVDLGPTLAFRARPCAVSGQIQLNGIDPRTVEAQLVFPSNSFSERRPYRKALNLDERGIFETWAHTSPDATPAFVRWRVFGEGKWRVEEAIGLVPGGHQTVVVAAL